MYVNINILKSFLDAWQDQDPYPTTQSRHVRAMCACLELVSGCSGFTIVNCISLVIVPTVWPEHAMVCRLITCEEKKGVSWSEVPGVWCGLSSYIISSRSITVHHYPVCCCMRVWFAFRTAHYMKLTKVIAYTVCVYIRFFYQIASKQGLQGLKKKKKDQIKAKMELNYSSN